MALLVRLYRYFVTKARLSHERRADPRVELEQSLEDARRQHRQLRDRAAQVIAHEKHTQAKLRKASDSAEQLRTQAQQALQLADEAQDVGDSERAQEMQLAAESFAQRLIAVEDEVDDLKAIVTQAQSASQEAREAVQQHADQLRQRLRKAVRMRGQIEQTSLSRQLNDLRQDADELARSAHESPTLEQVGDKVERQYSEELGRQDALEASNMAGDVSDHIRRRRAESNVEIQGRLRQLRGELNAGRSESLPPSNPDQ